MTFLLIDNTNSSVMKVKADTEIEAAVKGLKNLLENGLTTIESIYDTLNFEFLNIDKIEEI